MWDLGKCKASRALLMLFITWNVTQSVWSSWKWCIVIHHDRKTHPLSYGCILTIKHSAFFIMTRLIVEKHFMLLLFFSYTCLFASFINSAYCFKRMDDYHNNSFRWAPSYSLAKNLLASTLRIHWFSAHYKALYAKDVQSVAIIVIQMRKQGWACRYSSGHLFPIIQSC